LASSSEAQLNDSMNDLSVGLHNLQNAKVTHFALAPWSRSWEIVLMLGRHISHLHIQIGANRLECLENVFTSIALQRVYYQPAHRQCVNASKWVISNRP
jgi:hypothetical protein